jgi:hypothetical protein
MCGSIAFDTRIVTLIEESQFGLEPIIGKFLGIAAFKDLQVE